MISVATIPERRETQSVNSPTSTSVFCLLPFVLWENRVQVEGGSFSGLRTKTSGFKAARVFETWKAKSCRKLKGSESKNLNTNSLKDAS
jgi:hypothetical protein